MSERKRFVRFATPIMLLAQLLREQKGDVRAAITWAERLWEGLVDAGHGPRKAGGSPLEGDAGGGGAAKPRPLSDHVGALSEPQRAAFERLWRAYAYPKGKQGAAQRWAQLAPDDDLGARIIAAAEADAREVRPEGQARKWLQGWLTERRWEDRPEGAADAQGVAVSEIAARRLALAELLGERRRLSMLVRHNGEDAAAAEALARVDESLRRHGIEPGGSLPKAGRQGPRAIGELAAKLGRGPLAGDLAEDVDAPR